MNPPVAPVGCETCGAVAGATCKTGMGSVAAKIHAARARDVARFYEEARYTRPPRTSPVAVLDDYRRRRARAGAR